jgi:hypothetical protein
MKNLYLGIALLLANGYAQAQNMTKARFTVSGEGDSFRFIELTLDNGMQVGIDDCREIAYIESTEDEHFADVSADDPKLPIKYYNEFDIHDSRGKIKSIGNIVFKYNNAFDIHDKFGTLKSVGNIPIRYYNSFDIHDPQGKVKSVGAVDIHYYNTFDINDRFGDLKSIKGNSSALSVSIPYRRRFAKNVEH